MVGFIGKKVLNQQLLHISLLILFSMFWFPLFFIYEFKWNISMILRVYQAITWNKKVDSYRWYNLYSEYFKSIKMVNNKDTIVWSKINYLINKIITRKAIKSKDSNTILTSFNLLRLFFLDSDNGRIFPSCLYLFSIDCPIESPKATPIEGPMPLKP